MGLAALLLCSIGVGLSLPLAQAADGEFWIIVDAKNPSAQLSREFLVNAFLKRTSRWDDGDAIHPVDLRADSATRKRFSESILKRSVAAVRSYWQQQIFSGRNVPPPELEADEAVVTFVRKNKGAIGYVSTSAKTDGVKVVVIQ